MHTYIHTYIHAYIHTACVLISVCVCVCMYIRMYSLSDLHIYAQYLILYKRQTDRQTQIFCKESEIKVLHIPIQIHTNIHKHTYTQVFCIGSHILEGHTEKQKSRRTDSDTDYTSDRQTDPVTGTYKHRKQCSTSNERCTTYS